MDECFSLCVLIDKEITQCENPKSRDVSAKIWRTRFVIDHQFVVDAVLMIMASRPSEVSMKNLMNKFLLTVMVCVTVACALPQFNSLFWWFLGQTKRGPVCAAFSLFIFVLFQHGFARRNEDIYRSRYYCPDWSMVSSDAFFGFTARLYTRRKIMNANTISPLKNILKKKENLLHV